jgi:hypothetical protein
MTRHHGPSYQGVCVKAHSSLIPFLDADVHLDSDLQLIAKRLVR